MNNRERLDSANNNKSFEWIVEPLLHWYDAQARNLPWRENRDPYRVWISEIMLQQTRVEAVIAYFNRFMKSFPNVQVLAKAEEETVLKLWEGLGYYSRARNLKKAAEIICEKHDGIFPQDYKEILALPGIENIQQEQLVRLPLECHGQQLMEMFCVLLQG